TLSGFAAALDGIGGNFIVSGGDWAAVKRLSGEVPGMRRGYDPCEVPEAARLASPEGVAAFVEATERIAPEAEMIYRDYRLVLRALAGGSDIVDSFHRRGQTVDAWTLNTDHPNALASLRKLVRLRVDQITTDEPIRLDEIFLELAPTLPGAA